jgi:RND family efflux transporter MFP subunit
MKRLIYLLALAPAALGAADKPAVEPPAPINAVKVVSAKKVTESRPFDLPGRTEAAESATVFTRATGIVRERKLDIGDTAKAGDVLAEIDAPEIDRQVDSAKAAVEAAVARANNARLMADRAKTLRESGTFSQEDYDQREANAKELEAAVRVAQAEQARWEEQQRFSTVRAPFDAVVTARNFDRGDRVRGDSSTSENWLYQLARLDQLTFVLNAPPDIALRTNAETSAAIRFNEFPGQKFNAKLTRTSRSFDEASGTMRLEFTLENPELKVPAGLTGTATLTLAPSDGSYLVPTNALVVRVGKSTLMTVAEGKVKVLDVLPGRNLGPNVEVTSAALTPETQIIVNPNAMLKPGDAVTIKDSPPANATAAK